MIALIGPQSTSPHSKESRCSSHMQSHISDDSWQQVTSFQRSMDAQTVAS